MPTEFEVLLARFNRNPPAPDSVIVSCGTRSGVGLPADYLRFMRIANGGEGFIGSSYAILWKLEDLQQINMDYQVAEFAPELFIFGSDGGGEAFGFDFRGAKVTIVRVPFIPLDFENAIVMGQDFPQFLETLFESK
ncbi:MAG: SMI1/KNR4 family protein [Planctomycetes bacterium]|nr:SMI1/KNR4 family protein [Planctomycetota bacterium]